MDAVTQLAPVVGAKAACDFLGVARASFYRKRPLLGPVLAPTAPVTVGGGAGDRPAPAAPLTAGDGTGDRPASPRALSPQERAAVLAVLHQERFQNQAPAAIQATLLDEGQYLCSVRTMYRLLEQQGETRERRDQLVHPPYQKPELLATAPNQLWSWDITKLLGPAKWTYFYRHRLPPQKPGGSRPGQIRMR
jgi:putative transposase